MSDTDTFDPYYTWLGIPPEEQPPDHYRLLGIQRFESDQDVISIAADRQMNHLRTYQGGSRAEASQRLLNEVATAKVCLLDESDKAKYDNSLNSQPPRSSAPPPVGSSPPRAQPKAANRAEVTAAAPFAEPAEVDDTEFAVHSGASSNKSYRAVAPRRPKWVFPAMVSACIIIVGAVAVSIIFALNPPDDSPNIASRDDGPSAEPPKNPDENPDSDSDSDNDDPPVKPEKTTVAKIRSIGEVTWADDFKPESDQALEAGQTISLAQGFVEVTYESGALVVLQGPAEFELKDENTGLIKSGTLTLKRNGTAGTFSVVSPAGDRIAMNRRATIRSNGRAYYDGVKPPVVVVDPKPPVDPPVAPTQRKGLVAHWPFDGNGSDLSGSSFVATFRLPPDYSAGKLGQAADLKRGNAITINQRVLHNADQLTFAVWLQLRQISTAANGVAFRFGGNGLNVMVARGRPYLVLPGASKSWNTSLSQYQDTWMHLAITYDMATREALCFINGKPTAETSVVANAPLVNLMSVRCEAQDGLIDELRIYDTALSAAEIEKLASLQSAPVAIADALLNVPFEKDVADAKEFLAEHSNLKVADGSPTPASLSVTDGVAKVTGNALLRIDTSGLEANGDLVYSIDLGATDSSSRIGLKLGDNLIRLYPSLGAVKVDGPGGWTVPSIGFKPALNVLHRFELKTSRTGELTISLTDGSEASNVFTKTITNPDSVGQEVAIYHMGSSDQGLLFDNLTIRSAGGSSSPKTPMTSAGDLAGHVELPPLDASDKSVRLGTIPGAGEILVEMLGGDKASRKLTYHMSEAVADGDDGFHWDIEMRLAAGSAVNIARMTYQQGELEFHWSDEIVDNEDANYIRNCLLVVYTEKSETQIALRKPVEVEALAVDMVRGGARVRPVVNWLPPGDDVRVGVTSFDAAPNTTSDTDMPFAAFRGEKTIVYVTTDGARLEMKLQGGSSQLQLGMSLQFSVVTQKSSMVMTKANLRKAVVTTNGLGTSVKSKIAACTKELDRLRRSYNAGTISSYTSYRKKKAAVEAQQTTYEGNLSTVQRGLRQLQQLEEFYGTMHLKTKVHFRIYRELGDQKLDLVRSSDS
jgi:hypothetical protein